MFFKFNTKQDFKDKIQAEEKKRKDAILENDLTFLICQYKATNEPHLMRAAQAIVKELGIESKLVLGVTVKAFDL